eukprot:Seg13117.1 transcript_id=Seg13117.1/GoldUCD/mRNA.D3Y31 product="Acid-sensing ion channel 1C" protein_id=Seg13117.1/GoldUCD/D3Y31
MDLKTSAENVTMHGFARISITKWKFLKLFWLISMLSFSAMLIYQVQDIVFKFFERPSVTKHSTVISSKMQFPSVTICASSLSKPKVMAFSNKTMIEESFELAKQNGDVELGVLTFATSILNNVIKTTKNLKNLSFNRSAFMMEKLRGGCSFAFKFACNFSKDFKDIIVIDRGSCHNFNWHGQYHQKRAGQNDGLSMILFLDVDNAMPLSSSNTGDGVELLLQHHMEYPFPSMGSVLAPVGHLSRIEISKSEILRMRHPYPSDCIDGEGIRLLYPGEYTIHNCQESCLAYKAAASCDFVDFYMNTFLPANFKKNFSKVMNSSDCWVKKYDELNANGFKICNCKLPCYELQFHKSVSYSKWPSTADIPFYRSAFSKALGFNESLMTEEFIRRNFLKMNIFFQSMSFERMTEEKKYTPAGIISDVGGQMGIWIGASMFSVMELIYLFAQFLHRVFSPRKKANDDLTFQNTQKSSF